MMNNITTNIAGMLAALSMSVDDLRADRRFARVTGSERVVIERKGTQFHIVDAPAWMCVQDFGPFGMRAAKKAGWL
jgi:hypothetical protein